MWARGEKRGGPGWFTGPSGVCLSDETGGDQGGVLHIRRVGMDDKGFLRARVYMCVGLRGPFTHGERGKYVQCGVPPPSLLLVRFLLHRLP